MQTAHRTLSKIEEYLRSTSRHAKFVQHSATTKEPNKTKPKAKAKASATPGEAPEAAVPNAPAT